MTETSVSVSNKLRKQRPLSPHLQVYKPQLTSMMSIAHRISGIFLTLGLLLFAWWVIALAFDEDAFDYFMVLIYTIPGMIIATGCLFALFFHLATGIRHLFWDMGLGFSIEATYRSGYAVIAFAFLATILVWAIDFGRPLYRMGRVSL